ncbi:hypothetical protein M0R45_005190 [Rubus argutus]|uniref:Uncharacterized protein n=1 Tax=Rubus argutus TaxID=59490 RepID=A0AAW1YM26_RUBAR
MEIETSRLEIELLASKLRDYEPGNDSTLAQVLWCEKNLKDSLQRITDWKIMMLANNLSSSNGQVKFQPFQNDEQMNQQIEKIYHQNQMNMQACAPSLYGFGGNGLSRFWSYVRRVGTKGLSSSNGVLGGVTGLLAGSSNNYRSNFILAPSSSQSIYQSAGALSFPTPKAQISPANYNTYAPIQHGQIGSVPPISTHFNKIDPKEVKMFTRGNNIITHNLKQNGEPSTQKSQQVEKEREKRKIDEDQEGSNVSWLDGFALAKTLSSEDRDSFSFLHQTLN